MSVQIVYGVHLYQRHVQANSFNGCRWRQLVTVGVTSPQGQVYPRPGNKRDDLTASMPSHRPTHQTSTTAVHRHGYKNGGRQTDKCRDGSRGLVERSRHVIKCLQGDIKLLYRSKACRLTVADDEKLPGEWVTMWGICIGPTASVSTVYQSINQSINRFSNIKAAQSLK